MLKHYACLFLLAAAATAAPPLPSSIVLSSSPSPSMFGQLVTITATLTSGATGKVTFYDSTYILGISPITSAQAKLTTSLLPSGVRSLHAHYSGDANYLPSDSLLFNQLVTVIPANGFQQLQQSTQGSAGSSVVVVSADFNGDGKPDVAVLTQSQFPAPGNINILLGKGDGTFQSLPSVPAGLSPQAAAVGDFNGDGIPDLAIYGSSQTFVVLLGNGDGTFRTPIVSTTGLSSVAPFAVGIAVADFNNDGKADAILCDGTGFSVLLGKGDGTFQPPAANTAANPSSVWVADFNNDGKPDLLVNSGPHGQPAVYLGNGDGSFGLPVPIQAPTKITAAAAGDFNTDGKTDVAVVISGALIILLGNGDGTFQQHSVYPSTAAYLATGDFNGDGKMDLVAANNPLGSRTGPFGADIWLANGDGSFQSPVNYVVGATFNVSLPIVTDWNGDGKTDFIVLSNTANATALFEFLGTAMPDLAIAETHTGNFAPSTSGETYTLTVGNAPFAATTGTVTVIDTLPPGITATAIAGSGWNCTLATLTCTRSDSLAPASSYPPITITVSVANNVPGTITNTATVTGLGDVNPANNKATETIILRNSSTSLAASPNPALIGLPVTLTATPTLGSTGQITFFDGISILGISPLIGGQAVLVTRALGSSSHSLYAQFDPDAVSPYAASKSATVTETIIEAPANGFRPTETYSTASWPGPVVIGDFNGDGIADLAIGTRSSVVGILLGNGDGSFRDPMYFSAGYYIQSIAVADLNGDGKADLVVGSTFINGLGGVSVLLGNGDGTFQPYVSYARNIYVNKVAVADFNGDGKPDICFIQDITFGLMLGNGDGSFQQPVYSLLTSAPMNMVVADFNADGKPDLGLAFNPVFSPALTTPVNGTGPFEPQLVVSALSSSLVAGDFNGDGKVDLALDDHVLLGNGDGTFRIGGTYPSSTILAAADVNGDGKTDLIAAFGNSNNTVSIMAGNGDGTFQAPVTILSKGAYFTGAAVGDLNGDGKPDIAVTVGANAWLNILLGGSFTSPLKINLAVWRPSNGTWYVYSPDGPTSSRQWGLPGDIPVTADFNHDLLDYVVWRPPQGNWYIAPSSNPAGSSVRQWGLPGDIPVPGDFDADGITDLALWRPSNGTWYITPGSNPSMPLVHQWGLPGDVPVIADFDADAKPDYVVWRPSNATWYIAISSSGQTFTKQWGLPGDIPVAADFDGDGFADYAVWRPSNGTWYIIPSAHPDAPMTIQWGLPGDIPVPRDYDNDGKADLAVWRPSNGTWYIIPSSAPSAPLTIQWGLPGDVPLYRPPGF